MPFQAISSAINTMGNIVGSSLSDSWNQANYEKNFRANAALQKEFAQNSVQWKVADAKKAGIHPLAGLGAMTTSYTPQSLNFQSEAPRMNLDLGSLADIKTRQLQNELLETQIEAQKIDNDRAINNYGREIGLIDKSQNSNQMNQIVRMPPKNQNLAPRHLPESQGYKNPLNLTDDEQSQITTETMSQGGSIFSAIFDKFYRDHVDRENGLISEDEAYSFAERYLYGKYKVIPKGVNLYELAKMLYDKAREKYHTRDRKSSHRSNRPDVDLYMQNWGY